ncbi:hypothetical protein ABI_13160 [Asticcacaulis biprosthecium C19]|uniref:Novel toxin 21 domain-containing protein n=2 Tax=Asticcacaulis biprosthecium TaxID=76891 RepID=F4QI11_9CAUL|nr:hypothetical protein ABI_13160 [Asticcacaulis biprosthecium C19]
MTPSCHNGGGQRSGHSDPANRLTASQQKDLAKWNKWAEEKNKFSHGQPVFYDKQTRRYFSYDVDGHNGGIWKSAKSVDALKSKSTRLGTYDHTGQIWIHQ